MALLMKLLLWWKNIKKRNSSSFLKIQTLWLSFYKILLDSIKSMENSWTFINFIEQRKRTLLTYSLPLKKNNLNLSIHSIISIKIFFLLNNKLKKSALKRIRELVFCCYQLLWMKKILNIKTRIKKMLINEQNAP